VRATANTIKFFGECKQTYKDGFRPPAVNITDTIDGAKRAFTLAGRGYLVRIGDDEPRYATVSQIAARLEPHVETTMLLTAVSEAVERYEPARQAVILLETDGGFQVLILSPEGWDRVGGLDFAPHWT
jgi:hypothetical protein